MLDPPPPLHFPLSSGGYEEAVGTCLKPSCNKMMCPHRSIQVTKKVPLLPFAPYKDDEIL